MIPTPDLSHLTASDFESVYEPAEDTFALLDALEADAEAIRTARPLVCVEIGSGSGCVTSFASRLLDRSAPFICTDINRLALKATVATAERNQRPAPEVVLTSLLDGLDDRLSGQVDLLIFNPPYVETEEDESRQAQMASEALSSAWAGGHGGMSVTASLLAKVGRLLSPSGRLYLVAVTQNDPRAIVRAMQSEGLLAEVARCPIGGSQPA